MGNARAKSAGEELALVSGRLGTLNLVGAGGVGRTLGLLWAKAGVFEIQDVLARSRESASAAVKTIGGGHAVSTQDEMRPADAWLIATPDDAIAGACTMLARSGRLKKGDVVFHLSGATPSEVLEPARRCGAHVASVHPIKTFTDPGAAARTFTGTYCGVEGDAQALRMLRPAFEEIGARLLEIAPEMKGIYHAAGVFSCNYLAALIEAALQCHEKAGIPRKVSLEAIEPMVRETVDAVLSRGPARALTGPIARGDVATVARQLETLAAWKGDLAHLYCGLGLLAIKLAEADRRLDSARAADLRRVLSAEGTEGR